MFRFRKSSSAPAENPAPAKRAREPMKPWLNGLLTLSVVLVLIAGMIEGYRRLVDRYASLEVARESEKIPVSVQLMNKPSWLSKEILDSIQNETAKLAARDQATFDRFRNPLDQSILDEIHDNYVGTKDGVNRWAQGENAWIKRITRIQRVISPDRKSQKIEIFAEYRKPAAWIESDGKYYLIDTESVRLPGTFTLDDRKAAGRLMMITGVDLPRSDAGVAAVPEPSAAWSTDDLAAAMTLVPLLENQPYASQIAAIDMTNNQGRKNSGEPWIVLDTDRLTAAGTPACVKWGRPPGKYSYYEVSDKTKLQALSDLYMKFGRIDAGRDYVVIWMDQVRVPQLAAQAAP